jgi:hypothetical protein
MGWKQSSYGCGLMTRRTQRIPLDTVQCTILANFIKQLLEATIITVVLVCSLSVCLCLQGFKYYDHSRVDTLAQAEGPPSYK